MPIQNEQHIAQYRQLHAERRYGQTSHHFVPQIRACIVDVKPSTVLEYGCGQSEVRHQFADLPIDWRRYDPAIPEVSTVPTQRVDFMLNVDVMEHIPESDVDEVLTHMHSLSDCVFYNIATRPAKNMLPDGSNAHCTVWSEAQWLERIAAVFPDANIAVNRPGHSCTIVTWQSPLPGLLTEIEDLQAKAAAARQPAAQPSRGLLSRVAARLGGGR